MDAASGLTYMQQRYYDPQIGRFLSVDPVTAYSNPVGAFNRYWYASNNPYKFVDPDGRTDVNNFLQKRPRRSFLQRAAAASDLPGTFTVGSHGNESIIQDQTRAPYENWDAYQTHSNAVSMGLKPGASVLALVSLWYDEQPRRQSSASYGGQEWVKGDRCRWLDQLQKSRVTQQR